MNDHGYRGMDHGEWIRATQWGFSEGHYRGWGKGRTGPVIGRDGKPIIPRPTGPIKPGAGPRPAWEREMNLALAERIRREGV